MGRRDPENATYEIARSTDWYIDYQLGTDSNGTVWWYNAHSKPCDEDMVEIMRRVINDLASEIVYLRKKYEPEYVEVMSHLPNEPISRLGVIHTALSCNEYPVFKEHGRYSDKEETK